MVQITVSSNDKEAITKSRDVISKARDVVSNSSAVINHSRDVISKALDVTNMTSRDTVPSRGKSRVSRESSLELEDMDEDEDEDFEPDCRSSIYLQNHTSKNSERASMILKDVVADAIRDLETRSVLLEEGIQRRKSKIIESVEAGNNIRVKASTTVSDLFKLFDKRNTVKVVNGGSPTSDYKEFMFFDRDSAKNLNNAIKTLGDPSFNVSYSRNYQAIALNPYFIGGPGTKLGEFYGPTAVVTDEQHMYVCDSMNSRVVVFSDDKQPLYTIGSKGKGDSELDRPSSIAVDQTGQMFVADSFNDRICAFTTAGEWKFNLGGRGKLNKPRGVACSKNGEIIVVSDTANQRILVYSGSGDFKGNFGNLGMKEGHFVKPQGIKIHDNKVYVSDSFNYRVQVFDIEGKLLGSIGKHGSGKGEFEEPRDISIDRNGNVLVTDTQKNSLQIFDSNGEFVREYGKHGSGVHQFDGPEGVHTDDINRIFVADRKNNRVHVL